MAGMSADDVKKAKELSKALATIVFNSNRKETAELLKLTSQDKDLAKLAKAVETGFSPYFKCIRALSEALDKK